MVYSEPSLPVHWIVTIIGPARVSGIDDDRSVTGHCLNPLAVKCLELPGLLRSLLGLLFAVVVVITIPGYWKSSDEGAGTLRICHGIGLAAGAIKRKKAGERPRRGRCGEAISSRAAHCVTLLA